LGTYHIVSIWNDGIAGVPGQHRNPGLAQALGEAILKVCLDPDYAMVPNGLKRVTWAGVPGASNCVRWIDEKDYTEVRLYYASTAMSAFVRPMSECSPEELEEAKKLLDDELQRRRGDT
jgi:hypothetical protein